MIKRCYGKNKQPCYENVIVCEEWHTFSKFCSWVQSQGDISGLQLDKDYLGDGKVYSPDTCAFVSPSANKFLQISSGEKGSLLPPGVRYDERKARYYAFYQNTFAGSYGSELEAHQSWQKRKISHAEVLCRSEKDGRIRSCLVNIISNIKNDIENRRITNDLRRK